ncbi:hypothetical protein HMPREF1503_1740 [Olsenella uli MSTE5]|nr:hypothetical protein HMPREF1503_1740 [Olsenella uli MSTE5]
MPARGQGPRAGHVREAPEPLGGFRLPLPGVPPGGPRDSAAAGDRRRAHDCRRAQEPPPRQCAHGFPLFLSLCDRPAEAVHGVPLHAQTPGLGGGEHAPPVCGHVVERPYGVDALHAWIVACRMRQPKHASEG